MDEFKTQVLLLHSQQDTLDTLSSGFSDNYTVHCATSGSEALNTLVETPINVLISAQELPGMSGLEALREAKKRSPDTIGILLAGNRTSDIQALVGDEEVFQVVSGKVTSDGLLQLVDNATRQLRLMALADSANDATANMDISAEHIVMETSTSGSTIISDGTGRMPALDPKKVAAAASVGSRAVDILVLTKDQEFLETVKDSSRGMHKMYYANTLKQADDAIHKHKIGVAVVDAAMIGEKIEQLTQYLRKGSPRLVAIVAGRRQDGEMLMDLINRGKVYRFLLKPVSPGRSRLAVEASVKHHLEAPDATFNIKASPAAKASPTPKISALPTQKPAAKVAPVPTPAAPAAPTDPPLGSHLEAGDRSPMEDGLADAFGQDDSSFTATVTGLISSIGNKFSSENEFELEVHVPPELGASIADEADRDALANNAGAGGFLFRSPAVMGIGAAVIVIAGGLFWFMGESDDALLQPPVETRGTPSITEAELVTNDVPPLAETTNVDTLLEEARFARDAGQIFDPAENNAIELFVAALAADPENSTIVAELAATIEQALGLAESAMLGSRLDETDSALQRVTAVDPQNMRLPFLSAQLAQMQAREFLADARLAIREQRFADAATDLLGARSLSIPDSTNIDTVAAELSDARNAQQNDDLLAKAAARLNSGKLLRPANDNARYYYELVLSNNAGNTAARQGLSVVAGKLALQARAEIDKDNLKAAETILANARAVDATNREVASTVTALANTRAAIAKKQRQQEAAIQAEAERLAEAEIQAERERQAEVERLAREEQAAAKAKQPVAISSLTRRRYVAPKYPRTAQRRNISGWVDVLFTVAIDGTVIDLSARDSQPGDVFVNAALKAVEKWEFEPAVENGTAVERRTGVRMMFALE